MEEKKKPTFGLISHVYGSKESLILQQRLSIRQPVPSDLKGFKGSFSQRSMHAQPQMRSRVSHQIPEERNKCSRCNLLIFNAFKMERETFWAIRDFFFFDWKVWIDSKKCSFKKLLLGGCNYLLQRHLLSVREPETPENAYYPYPDGRLVQ